MKAQQSTCRNQALFHSLIHAGLRPLLLHTINGLIKTVLVNALSVSDGNSSYADQISVWLAIFWALSLYNTVAI